MRFAVETAILSASTAATSSGVAFFKTRVAKSTDFPLTPNTLPT
jgi:hypothetical protein